MYIDIHKITICKSDLYMINTYLCMYVCTYDMIVHSNVNSKHKSQNCNRLQKYKRPFEKQKKRKK